MTSTDRTTDQPSPGVCPICGCEERGQGGYLQCECPAPLVKGARQKLCEDCPPIGYPTNNTRCLPCPRRTGQQPAQPIYTKEDAEALCAIAVAGVMRVAAQPQRGEAWRSLPWFQLDAIRRLHAARVASGQPLCNADKDRAVLLDALTAAQQSAGMWEREYRIEHGRVEQLTGQLLAAQQELACYRLAKATDDIDAEIWFQLHRKLGGAIPDADAYTKADTFAAADELMSRITAAQKENARLDARWRMISEVNDENIRVREARTRRAEAAEAKVRSHKNELVEMHEQRRQLQSQIDRWEQVWTSLNEMGAGLGDANKPVAVTASWALQQQRITALEDCLRAAPYSSMNDFDSAWVARKNDLLEGK